MLFLNFPKVGVFTLKFSIFLQKFSDKKKHIEDIIYIKKHKKQNKSKQKTYSWQTATIVHRCTLYNLTNCQIADFRRLEWRKV